MPGRLRSHTGLRVVAAAAQGARVGQLHGRQPRRGPRAQAFFVPFLALAFMLVGAASTFAFALTRRPLPGAAAASRVQAAAEQPGRASLVVRGAAKKTPAAKASKPRGRPKKVAVPEDEPASQEEEGDAEASAAPPKEAPKRRGRPKKVAAPEDDPASQEEEGDAEASAAPPKEAPKRRGRPKKAAPPEDEPALTKEAEGGGEEAEEKTQDLGAEPAENPTPAEGELPVEEDYDDDDDDFEEGPMPRAKIPRRARRIQDEEILPPGTRFQGGRHGVQFFVGDMCESRRDGAWTVARISRAPTDERPRDGSFYIKWDDDGEEVRCWYRDLRKPRNPEKVPLPDWIEDWWPAEPPDPNEVPPPWKDEEAEKWVPPWKEDLEREQE